MANPKGHIPSLRSYQPNWKSGQTKTIRVPIALADQVMAYAKQIDSEPLSQMSQIIHSSPTSNESLSQVLQILRQLYQTPRNNFNKDRKALLQTAIDKLESLSQVN